MKGEREKQNHDVAKASEIKKKYGATLLRLLLLVAVVIVLVLNLFTHVFSVVHYYGESMEPALYDRQILVVHKTEKVGSGDIVAFYYNNKVLVRRVIAEGGSNITIEESGTVIVDGQTLEEPYVEEAALGQCNISFPCNVPFEEFFVMGDNRPISMDSRLEEIGTVPQDRVLGKVLFSFG